MLSVVCPELPQDLLNKIFTEELSYISVIECGDLSVLHYTSNTLSIIKADSSLQTQTAIYRSIHKIVYVCTAFGWGRVIFFSQ